MTASSRGAGAAGSPETNTPPRRSRAPRARPVALSPDQEPGTRASSAQLALHGRSGELALALGLRHPDVYGAVFSGSPGAGYKPIGVLPGSIPRTYLFAGTLEPFFLNNAIRWAVALRDRGAEVVMRERLASHGEALWQGEFPLMVAWAFGR